MRPSSVDTSEPACVNRKMLSMNNSTSWPCSSRKYSAMVSADSPTRIRRAGRLVHLAEHQRGVLEHVGVGELDPEVVAFAGALPTPANTDVPPKFRAMRLIISWISTVLPTGAAEQRDLAAADVGVSRSTTLRPVSSISVRGSSWSKAGGLRWIDQRSKSLP